VLAVPLFTCNAGVPAGVVVCNATTGARLLKLETAAGVSAQPVFASGRLFVADRSGELTAYEP